MRATLELTGISRLRGGRVVEDVCAVSIGEAESELVRLVAGKPTGHVVAPGETAWLSVTVGTDASRRDLAVEAHLISPWGIPGAGRAGGRGVVLRAGSTVDIGLTWPRCPGDARSGGRWSGIGCAGLAVGHPAVAVTVR